MEQVASTDGTPIAYERSGSGPALVLVHGASSDHTRWAPILPLLERHFTVYAVDRRGRGGSGDSDRYSPEREFEDLLAVIRAIDAPVDMLGHSYGGLCAVGAALQTSRLRRLVLYEPVIPLGVKSRPAPALARIQALIAAGDRDEAAVTFSREVVQLSEAEISHLRASPAAWARRTAAIHTVLREMEIAAGSYRVDLQPLSTLAVRTLLLLGSDSAPKLHEGANTLRATLPNAEVSVLKGQQHLAIDTAPQMLADEVIKFLTEPA